MHHSLNQTELPFIIVCETKHIKINHGRNNIHYLGNCTLYPLYSIRITNKFLLSTKGNIKILYTFPIILEKTHLFVTLLSLLLFVIVVVFFFFSHHCLSSKLSSSEGEKRRQAHRQVFTRVNGAKFPQFRSSFPQFCEKNPCAVLFEANDV